MGFGGTLQKDRAGNREDRVRREVQLLRLVRRPGQDTLGSEFGVDGLDVRVYSLGFGV